MKPDQWAMGFAVVTMDGVLIEVVMNFKFRDQAGAAVLQTLSRRCDNFWDNDGTWLKDMLEKHDAITTVIVENVVLQFLRPEVFDDVPSKIEHLRGLRRMAEYVVVLNHSGSMHVA